MNRHRSGDVLPLLREHRSVRIAVLPTLLILCLLHAATGLRSTLLDDGLSATAAAVITGATIVLALATAAELVALARSSHLTQAVPLSSPLFALRLALPTAVTVYGLGSSVVQLPLGASLAIACAGAIVMITAIRGHARREKRSRAYRLIAVGHPQHAEELIEECRADLRDSPLTAGDRSAVELLMASAIADLAMLVERYDDLPEAQRIVARWVTTGNPAAVVGAALSLAPAIVERAHQTGELEGLEEGLAVVAHTISAHPTMLPTAQRLLLLSHSRGLQALRSEAEASGDGARAQDLLAAAIDDLERALTLTRRGSTTRAGVTAELASIAWLHPRHDGLDGSIARCRAAVRSLRLRRVPVREAGLLALADLLAERALAEPQHERADLAEAVRLCELVARKGRRPHNALARLPFLLDASGADESVTAGAFRRAFASLCAVSFEDAATIAGDWGVWAESSCFTTEAAEAHLCWIRAIVTESQRLRLRGDARRPRWEVQTLTADAGFWLLAAARPRDAALTLELGCGVGLHERMHRERGAIERRLADAGRDDLAGRWLEIGERMAPQPAGVRATHRDASAASTVSVGGRAFRGHVSSRDFPPLADYERLVREISRVPGFEDVDAPATYEDLREAAEDGPLVYLAATPHGGFAVVVTQDAAQPAAVALPGLTSADIGARVGFGPEAPYERTAALELTLTWLGRHVLDPLAAALPPAALVTLIPVGAVALLPIHAAGMTRRADGGWRDRTGGRVFRYAPSARVLARAHETVSSTADPRRPVLSVAGPRAAGSGPPRAVDVSRAIAAQLADDDLVRRPASDGIEHVLSALGEDPIWLIGCLVGYHPVDPLSSSLQLADGRLSLRTVLAPERSLPRLAVMSACQTLIGPHDNLEELVGLGPALVHRGVAGVVCAPASVDERARLLLVLAFLQRFVGGAAPARALAEAQVWLASATNRQLAATLGALHAFPEETRLTRAAWERQRDFSDPHSWAVFSYCGA